MCVVATELDELLASLRAKALSGEVTLDQFRWFASLTTVQRSAMVEGWYSVADEPETVRTSVLRRLSSESLVVAATDGMDTIPAAIGLFTYIDSHFREWKADEASDSTPERPVEVHEMAQDANFQEMFRSLSAETDRLCMTQSQVISFVKTHRDQLRKDGYGTFFLLKSKAKFFVAFVRSDDHGRLGVGVDQFANDYVWSADDRHRVVVPQL